MTNQEKKQATEYPLSIILFLENDRSKYHCTVFERQPVNSEAPATIQFSQTPRNFPHTNKIISFQHKARAREHKALVYFGGCGGMGERRTGTKKIYSRGNLKKNLVHQK